MPELQPWFKQALEARWPGLLEVNFEPWPEVIPPDPKAQYCWTYIVIPIIGMSFTKRRDRTTKRAECRYMADDPQLQQALDWWPLESLRDFPARWVVREKRPGRKAARRFDCVTDEHEFVEPGERVIEAIFMRDGGDIEVERQIVAHEDYEQIEEDVYRTKRQVDMERQIETDMHDSWMDLAEKAGGVAKAYMYDPPQGGPGIKVTDKRRVH